MKFTCCKNFDVLLVWLAMAVIMLMTRSIVAVGAIPLNYGFQAIGCWIVWHVFSVGFILLALIGAIMKRSILLYPHLVTCLIEILLLMIGQIAAIHVLGFWVAIIFFPIDTLLISYLGKLLLLYVSMRFSEEDKNEIQASTAAA